MQLITFINHILLAVVHLKTRISFLFLLIVQFLSSLIHFSIEKKTKHSVPPKQIIEMIYSTKRYFKQQIYFYCFDFVFQNDN